MTDHIDWSTARCEVPTRDGTCDDPAVALVRVDARPRDRRNWFMCREHLDEAQEDLGDDASILADLAIPMSPQEIDAGAVGWPGNQSGADADFRVESITTLPPMMPVDVPPAIVPCLQRAAAEIDFALGAALRTPISRRTNKTIRLIREARARVEDAISALQVERIDPRIEPTNEGNPDVQ